MYSGFKFSQLEMSTGYLPSPTIVARDLTRALVCSEIVLSMLISNFKFELPGKPIAWNFAGISYPTMGYTSTKPEMLLKLSLATR